MSKRAVIYTRVSRDDTGEGRSVERQLDACRKLADMRGWEVVHEESDNSISAWSGKERPAWERTLNLVEARQVDVVIAWHIDRLTRSMVELERLILIAEEQGVGVATVTGDIDLTTDTGRMVARIIGAVARAEVERKAARQRLANEQRAQAGAPSTGGARPFGYARNHIDVIPEEAAAIADGARWALAGMSMREIARRWDEAGLKSSRADEMSAPQGWTGRGVKGVLVSPRYAGIRTYRGEEIGRGTWPPILDEETHRALKLKLSDPKRLHGAVKKGRTPSNLLTGIAKCSTCQKTVSASRSRGVLSYVCRPHVHVSAPRAVADAEVAAEVVAYLMQPNVLSHLTPTGDDEVDKARAEADELRERLDELAQAYAAGAVTLSQLTGATHTLRVQLEAAEDVLARAGAGELLHGLDVGTEQVAKQWNDLPLVRQRNLVEAVLDIEVRPVGGGGPKRSFDPAEHLSIAYKNAPLPA